MQDDHGTGSHEAAGWHPSSSRAQKARGGACACQSKQVRNGPTVVYIEADPANAYLMQCIFDLKSGYTLHHASDGQSGLELCKRVRPDLVLTEMILPDMTAYEVKDELQADAATCGTSCIVLSGDAIPNHVKRALDRGFDDYWTKPVDVSQLLQRLDDALVLLCQ